MLPGLQIQDKLLVEKLSYLPRGPKRGEIVVFNSPYAFDPALSPAKRPSQFRCSFANLPLIGLIPWIANPACDAYIKRVVAVAGDRVSVNPRGEVTLNGKLLDEPYVTNYCQLDPQGMSPCLTLNGTVPEDSVLALGDNRSNSWDGRFWPSSPYLPNDEIVGRAVWRFWPWSRIGSLSD